MGGSSATPACVPALAQKLLSSTRVEGIQTHIPTGSLDSQLCTLAGLELPARVLDPSHFLQKLIYWLIMLLTECVQGTESKTFLERQSSDAPAPDVLR